MGQGRNGSPDRVASLAGFTFGMATALAISSLRSVDNGLVALGERSPLPRWSGLAAVGIAALAFAIVPRLRRSPFLMLIAFGFVPFSLAASLTRLFEFGADTERTMRAVGLLLSFTMLFGSALWFARRKRELDRLVFSQASLVAFFAMVFVGVVFGIGQEFFRVPRLSFTWLALFGLGVWAAALSVYERRYG